ncbi:MAG: hypothetical protein EB120_06060 [Proteobacteria bacterium]|nr:hypothetical protein [Pseudomonadota bacterium]
MALRRLHVLAVRNVAKAAKALSGFCTGLGNTLKYLRAGGLLRFLGFQNTKSRRNRLFPREDSIEGKGKGLQKWLWSPASNLPMITVTYMIEAKRGPVGCWFDLLGALCHKLAFGENHGRTDS